MFILSALDGTIDINDIVMLVFLGLVTLICVFIGVWFIAANVNKPDRKTLGKKMRITDAAFAVSGVGFAIRVAFSLATVGYLGIKAAQPHMSERGLLELYTFIHKVFAGTVEPGNIYPLPGYLGIVMGGILKLFGAFDYSIVSPVGNVWMQVFIRLPYMLCDTVAVMVLFKIAKKYSNGHVALGLSAIYALCPIFFFGSSMWGSHLSILSLLILLSLYFMTQKNFLGLTVAYGLTLLTAIEALYFLPVFAVFYAYHFIRGLKLDREAKKQAMRAEFKGGTTGKIAQNAKKPQDNNTPAKMTFKECFFDAERGLAYRIPVYIIGSLIVMYLVSLPMLGGAEYNFFTWFAQIYIYPFSRVDFFGINAFKIYNLFGMNNAHIGENVSGVVRGLIGFGFMAIATALVYVMYSSRKNRANMVLIACYVFVTLSVYSMGMSEMSLLPVLAALLLAFALVKDKRILHIFSLLAFVMIINGCAVMVNAGYFTVVSIKEFALGEGSAFLSDSTFGTVMNTVCTVLAVLTHLYFTLVALDVSISNKRLLFAPQNDSFGESVGDWFRLK
ncbi:MAG: hypothetical protein FWE84_03255 [Firmicutes bacterium]|nr:hypothetical protein [Bacillota bacterium]